MLQPNNAVSYTKIYVLMCGINSMPMWSEFVLKHSETKEATH